MRLDGKESYFLGPRLPLLHQNGLPYQCDRKIAY